MISVGFIYYFTMVGCIFPGKIYPVVSNYYFFSFLNFNLFWMNAGFVSRVIMIRHRQSSRMVTLFMYLAICKKKNEYVKRFSILGALQICSKPKVLNLQSLRNLWGILIITDAMIPHHFGWLFMQVILANSY